MINPANKLSGDFKVLLVGCGEMGQAVMKGWLGHGLSIKRLLVVEPKEHMRQPALALGVSCVDDFDDIPADYSPDIVFFAVRPQRMDEIVPPYRTYASRGTAFVSIAAGKPLVFFEKHLGEKAELIRAMPNSPAKVGRGVTVATASENVTEDRRLQCSLLLESVGEVVWVRDENLMDAVTAVSGSGPAYVFHLVEALAKAGERAGLPAYLSQRLARATVCGAGELMFQTPESAHDLRCQVCTRGGTTSAAFEILLDEENGMTELMTKAVGAATRRSNELGR